MALPLAVLLSSLMTFGNLGENYELVAIKASGISLQKVMKPLIIFIIFVSIGALYFSNNILPKANLKFLTLLRDVRHKKPAVQIKEGVFYNEISDYVIKVGKKDQDGITIHDIVIYNHLKGKGNTNLTIAKDGRMEMTADKRYLVFTLFDGVNYDEDVPINKKTNYTWRKQWNTALQTTYFKKEIQRFDLSAFAFKKSNSDLYRNNYQMLNLKQLQFFEDSLSRARDSVIRKYQEYNVNDLNFLTLYDREQAKDTTHNIVDSLLNKQKTVAQKTSKEKNEGTIPDLERVNPLFTAKKKDSAKLAATVIDTNMLDTNLAFQADILSNFPKDMQRKIVSSALQSIRNASYHSSIIVTNIEGRDTYIVKHKIEWHKKFTLSFACIILFFIGAPLGAIIRKGGLGMPLVISVVMFVLYHILSIVGEKSVKEFVMEPWFGMWLASMAFLPLGIFFTIKATSDAPLMETEAWQKFFTKLLHHFKKNKQKK
jgi:lipopolysaccharide export system permease protein